MNKLINIVLLGCFLFSWVGCDQDIDFPYEGKDRIQFRHYTVVNKTRVYSDSLVFSFGLRPDTILIDTAKIVMEYLGKGSDVERTYKVLVVPDSTTAVAGTHYEALEELQKFRPGKLTDTLRLVIYRENLSTSFRHPETIRLDLRLEPTDDFDLGLGGGLSKKVLLNNYLSEPDWWNDNTGLGYYHPEKWKILISFNELYANQHECPFDTNNEGQTYARGLRAYLEAIPTFDEETGERVYMDELVPQE